MGMLCISRYAKQKINFYLASPNGNQSLGNMKVLRSSGGIAKLGFELSPSVVVVREEIDEQAMDDIEKARYQGQRMGELIKQGHRLIGGPCPACGDLDGCHERKNFELLNQPIQQPVGDMRLPCGNGFSVTADAAE